jgi:hypothetical protein
MCGSEGVYGISFFFFLGISDFAIWSLLSLGFDFQGVQKGLSLPLSHQMARINIEMLRISTINCVYQLIYNKIVSKAESLTFYITI